jgi:SAM-dependent methyltransferase
VVLIGPSLNTGTAAIPALSVHAWLRYDAISRLIDEANARTVLEIGAGLGGMALMLAARFDYQGIDLDEVSTAHARALFAQHGLDVDRLRIGGLEQVSGRTFDLVCAFEVLEHFEDDYATLAEWRQFVAPGGALLVSVPAGPDRFGKADVKAGHFRRYRRGDIQSLLTASGFQSICILNYGFPVGYVLEAVRNLAAHRQLRRRLTPEERTIASGRWLQPPQRLARLTHGVARPLACAQRPFMRSDRGTGLVALARLA